MSDALLSVKGTSKNPILRAAALWLACLPRFVTIRRDSKKIITYSISNSIKH